MCDAQLTFADLEFGDVTTLGGNDITIVNGNITFTSIHLSKGHTYDVAIYATNIAGSAISHTSIDILMPPTDMFTATTTATGSHVGPGIHGDDNGKIFTLCCKCIATAAAFSVKNKNHV